MHSIISGMLQQLYFNYLSIYNKMIKCITFSARYCASYMYCIDMLEAEIGILL